MPGPMDAAPLGFDPIMEARRQWVAHGWESSADGMAVITSVMRVHQVFLAAVDAVLRPYGLSFARYEALTLLSLTRTGSMPLGKIGLRLQVHPASVTNVVDRLQDHGFVRRRAHPTDGRTTLAEITDRGRSLVVEATRSLNEEVFVLEAVTDEECQRLVELLAKIRRHAGDFTDATDEPAVP